MMSLQKFCTCWYDEAKLKSLEIDKEIRTGAKLESKRIKLLLLGAGESGKSTIVKQMRIIHGGGYSESDRTGFKIHVYKNLCSAMVQLVTAMKMFPDLEFEDPESDIYVENLEAIDCENVSNFRNLNEDIFDAIESLWNDNGIRAIYEKRNLFKLADSAKYYFDDISRIRNKDYIPTMEDILRVRIATKGIVEYPFELSSGITINMVDVGGQKNERKKWIHCFDQVTSIIFLASLSAYDEVVTDSGHANGVRLAVDLFKTIISYDCFENTSVILFLNKKDIFEEKIKTSHIKDYLKEYDGPIKDTKSGKDFILNLFLNVNSSSRSSENTFFSHETCATDTENIKFVFNSTRDIILRQNLEETAMF